MAQERQLLITQTACPDALGRSKREPYPITLYVTAVSGVREGRPDVVCPKLVGNKCTASMPADEVGEMKVRIAIGARSQDFKSVPDCIQKNPQ